MKIALLLFAWLAHEGAALAAEAKTFTDFRQVVLVTRTGDLEPEMEAAALEAVSRSIQRGLMRGLGSELVGAGANFKKRKETQLGSLITSIAAIDRFLNEEALSTFGRNAKAQRPGGVFGRNQLGRLSQLLQESKAKNQYGSISLEWMILPPGTPVPPTPEGSMGGKLKESALMAAAQLADLAKLSGTPKDFDNALKVYDVADGTEIVTSDDKDSLYRAGYFAYKQLLAMEGTDLMPAHLRFVVSFVKGEMKVLLQAKIKPAHMFQRLEPPEGVVAPRIMEYTPHLSFRTDSPAVMQVGMERTYGKTEDEAILHVMFARYLTQDIRMVGPCWLKCEPAFAVGNVGSHYPTIAGTFEIDKGIKKPKVRRAVEMLVDKISGSRNFYILLQDIGIRIDRSGMTVDPKLTAVTLGVGEGKKLRVFNAWNNVKVMGTDVGVLGFDVYSQVLGPEVAKNLTTEVRNSVGAANQEAADTLKAALAPVTDLLK